MPKKPKYELIPCAHFLWRISRRGKVWQADGRSNPISAGRHSLTARDKHEALRNLQQLDEARAIALGLIDKPRLPVDTTSMLTIKEGRRLYEEYFGRARVTGGVADSTKKRYRAIFDKFVPWASSQGLNHFQQIDARALNDYAAFLKNDGYADKTLVQELTVLKQAIRWLIENGDLTDMKPIVMRMRKPQSQRPYCYRPQEVEAMLIHCREQPALNWLGDVIAALACTGVRIDELVNLKWEDVDFELNRISLADESNRAEGRESGRTLKSGKSRSFPLHSDLAAVLRRLPRSDSYVFHGPRKGRLKADFVRLTLIGKVLKPLAKMFPATEGKSFINGRLHTFRHYFISMCAAAGVPERVVMEWVGHADSAMVRHYFHLHDEEAQRRMNGLNLLSGAGGRSAGEGPKL
jgi:integrase